MLSFIAIAALALAAPTEFATGEVEVVAEGFQFTEGPVWLSDGTLLFSDIPANRIYRADKTVFREPSGNSNGLTLDREGRLLAAEHGNRRVSRTEKDGTIMSIAEFYESKRLNSPNDMVVRADGTIFFTDPPYGLEGGLDGPNSQLGYCGIYAISPEGDIRLLNREMFRPNGITLSPDEKHLYVADSEENHLRRWDLAEDGALSNEMRFYEVPNPDGIKTDTEGNIWITAKDGVHVVSPEGKRLDLIEFPTQPANCAFGGKDGKTLYVTARDKVYKVPVKVFGLHPSK